MKNEPNITDWISSISGLISALVAVFGVYYAYKQISAWKAREKAQNRIGVAKSLLSTATQIVSELRIIRSPRPGSDVNTLQKRYSRLYAIEPKFQSLIEQQIIVKSLLQDVHVNTEITKLLEIRNKLIEALEFLMELPHADQLGTAQNDDEVAYRKVAFGSFKEGDDFGVGILNSFASIEERLIPEINLERQ